MAASPGSSPDKIIDNSSTHFLLLKDSNTPLNENNTGSAKSSPNSSPRSTTPRKGSSIIKRLSRKLSGGDLDSQAIEVGVSESSPRRDESPRKNRRSSTPIRVVQGFMTPTRGRPNVTESPSPPITSNITKEPQIISADYEIKTLLLGHKKSGKTSYFRKLFNACANMPSANELNPGIDQKSYTFRLPDQKTILAKLRDMQSDYAKLGSSELKTQLKDMHAAIIIYNDDDNYDSFNVVESWIQVAKKSGIKYILLFFNNRHLSMSLSLKSSGETLAENCGCLFYSGNIKEAENVQTSYNDLLCLMYYTALSMEKRKLVITKAEEFKQLSTPKIDHHHHCHSNSSENDVITKPLENKTKEQVEKPETSGCWFLCCYCCGNGDDNSQEYKLAPESDED